MDRSLKFHSHYLKWEALWSEVHGEFVRFDVVDQVGMIHVVTLNGLAILSGALRWDQVCRPAAMEATR